ncbi:ABC transporter permease [Phormidium sp. CCY1219]|uniref:ABC transporter permease n=1 Tax=Phormidium sp. CCY1219 TaxID=2886104 RepID=UPI002D1F37AC|nr:ABC transporter permease [Phormidium sp. CCY1219]MEB3829165.1 ABC transporter permease [Phormidium sp. CCY1219]
MGIIFANVMAIYRKELQSYFVSPLAYAIAGVFWLIAGIFLVAMLLGPEGIIQQVAMMDVQGQQMNIPIPAIDVAYQFLQNFLAIMGNLSLFVLPILSMGLYAEERKRGTLELLATSPITNWAVATGKLLGVVTFFIAMVLPLLALEAIALTASNPPLPLTVPLLGHLGLILLGAAVLSLGMFVSSLTDSTILSAVLTFSLVLFLWIIDVVANNVGGVLGDALEHLSLLKHYSTLIRGQLDPSSLILFASYVVLGIFLTAQSIDALRFQRS